MKPRTPLRADLQVVADLIDDGSRVLDLGCGPGKLMRQLMVDKHCSGIGVEIDPADCLKAIRYGVPLIELDIDSQLNEFADKSYDVVVLSRTLQATHRPAHVLSEIARIGLRCIVSVPNFGYWRHRLVLLGGRMPMSRELPYSWHDTPNIHLSTLRDLEELFASVGLRIQQTVLFTPQGQIRNWPPAMANLLAANAIYSLVPADQATN